jgi:hypothetical protein
MGVLEDGGTGYNNESSLVGSEIGCGCQDAPITVTSLPHAEPLPKMAAIVRAARHTIVLIRFIGATLSLRWMITASRNAFLLDPTQ